jgi:tetratricopeptide (TPR) repeat protein
VGGLRRGENAPSNPVHDADMGKCLRKLRLSKAIVTSQGVNQTFDVFFSYRRADLVRAQPLLNALREAGVHVWRDETNIPENQPITPEIRESLAASKALIAFFSSTYLLSRPCQQELTAAWLAAQRAGEVPFRRVLVVNPEVTFDHLPTIFAEQQSIGWPSTEEGFRALAARIGALVDPLNGTLESARLRLHDAYYGMTPVEAVRFVGRLSELWHLHGLLTANRTSIVSGVVGQAVAQVRGLGGNGKSLLAREYAIRFGPAFPGGIFWLQAFGSDGVNPGGAGVREARRIDQIRAFALQLDLRVDRLKPDEIEAALWGRLRERAQPCLWIVDDMPSGLTIGELERRWISQWGGASVLITTRSTDYGALGNHLDLDVLGEAAALELLVARRRPRDPAEEGAARQIIERIGFHPLATEVTASYLAKGLQDYGEFLRELDSPDHDAIEFGARLLESLPTGHERSISQTLLKSIRMLGPEGTDFLRIASILAAAPIPVRLMEAVFAKRHNDSPAPLRLLEALDQTDTLSLSTRTGDDARLIHPLVSRTMRYHFGDAAPTAQTVNDVVRALTSLFERIERIREDHKVSRELVHARHLIEEGVDTEAKATLAAIVGQHDYDWGDYASARTFQEQTVQARRTLNGDDHPATTMALNNVALTTYHLGDLATARRLQEQVLEANRRVHGDGHTSTLKAMCNLAQTLQNQGELARARELQEQVVRRLQDSAEPEEIDLLLIAVNALALTLSRQGERIAARRFLEEVLRRRIRVSGQSAPHTLSVMNNLALSLFDDGELQAAANLQEHVLKARRQLLGGEHPDTLRAQANLARTTFVQRDFATALKLQQEVVDTRTRRLGPEHFETLLAMNSLATMLHSSGDKVGGEAMQRVVLDATTRAMGEEHSDAVDAANNLAQMIKARGDFAGARALQERVLRLRRERQGLEHNDTSIAAHNLVRTLMESRDRTTMNDVIATHLRWLLEADSARLSPFQVNLRRWLQAERDNRETRDAR